jgi:hypothetical protein
MTTVGVVMNLSTRIVLFLAAIVVVILLAGRASRAADDCITKPNAAPPQGSHWYYRTDRTMQRQCWYLRAEGEKVRAGVQQPTAAVQPPSAPKPVPTPAPQVFEAAAVESAVTKSKAVKDLPMVVASLETSGLGRPKQRARDDAHERSAREMSDGAVVAPSDVATAERPAKYEITFAKLAILAAVLVLIAIIVRTIFRLSAVRRSRQTNVHDWTDLASKLRGLDEHARPKMKPIMQQVSDTAADFEDSVRLLLRELQLRQHHNESSRMHVAQNNQL